MYIQFYLQRVIRLDSTKLVTSKFELLRKLLYREKIHLRITASYVTIMVSVSDCQEIGMGSIGL